MHIRARRSARGRRHGSIRAGWRTCFVLFAQRFRTIYINYFRVIVE